MFEKNMKVAYLLDFYADALDEHVGSVMKSYYEDDLSLSEIASCVGISRQGIRHLIKKGEEQLFFFEERFGLAKKYDELSSAVELLSGVYESLKRSSPDSTEASDIKKAIEIILKGNQDVRESD